MNAFRLKSYTDKKTATSGKWLLFQVAIELGLHRIKISSIAPLIMYDEYGKSSMKVLKVGAL